MRTLYALLTENCNLSCRYCDIKQTYGEEEWREESFFSSLKSFLNDEVVLFGGEPTMYKSRLYRALDLCPNASISTNLIFCDQEVLDRISTIPIATTFRPLEKPLMDKWVGNIKYLISKSANILILVTLDLFMLAYLSGTVDFEKIIDKCIIENKIPIRFEPLIDSSTDEAYFRTYDRTLLKILSDHFDEPERYVNLKELTNYKKDCSQVYTLYPNGKIKHGCPHSTQIAVCKECLTCYRNDICQPCRLQSLCSFPKNTYEVYMIYKGEMKNGIN